MFKSIISRIGIIAFSLILLTLHIMQPSSGLTTLTTTHAKNALVQKPSSTFTQGQKARWLFTSEYNYLGTIIIHFDSHNRFINDRLVFKLKEKGGGGYIYENTYNARDIKDLELFPFGFPPISDSKNKVYEVELVSLQGKSNEAVELHTKQPLFQSKYQYPKHVIVSSKTKIIEFIGAKILNSFKEYNLLIVLAFCLLLLTSLFITPKRTTLLLVFLSMCLLILYYALAIPHSYIAITCICVITIYFLSMRSQHSRTFSILFTLYLLAVFLIAASVGYSEVANKLGTLWLFVSLATSIGLTLPSFRRK